MEPPTSPTRHDSPDPAASSAAVLSAIVACSEDAIFTTRPDGTILSWSPAAERLYGHASSDAIGRSIAMLVYEPEVERHREILRRATADEMQRELRVTHVRRDGERLSMSLAVAPIAEHGVVSTILWIGRDISQLRFTAQLLEESEQHFHSLFEYNLDAVFALDRSGRFYAVNPAFARLSGYARDEVLGRSLAELLPAESVRDALRILRRVIGGEPQEWELPVLRRDGTRRIARGTAMPMILRGEIVGAYGVAADVTELLAAQERVRQAEKLAAVGQLVSGVAHELNNPLSAILLFAETLLQDERPAADAEALGVIRDQANRSRKIVRDLLTFARSGQAKQEEIELAPLLARCVRGLEPQVEALGCRLETVLAVDGTRLVGDQAGLGQVVTNLVINAAQAAGTGGTVRLVASAAEGRCELVVEDDGPGIPPEVMPRLFEPFFTTKPTGEGTGLGLPVSLGIVQQHKGTLVVANRDPRGARFTIELPCLPAPAPADARTADAGQPSGESSVAPASPAAPPRVLIIDDEPAIRHALRRFFTRRGWAVEEASDGGAALDLLLAGPGAGSAEFSLIVSDLKMPGLTGVELHDRLAIARPELLTRLIVSTGDIASPEAAAFVARTSCLVLQKPFELSTLGEAVERIGRRAPVG